MFVGQIEQMTAASPNDKWKTARLRVVASSGGAGHQGGGGAPNP